MNVEVKLFASLREGRGPIQNLQMEEGSTIQNIADNLKIKNSEISLIFVRGRHESFDYVLQDNDTISLFPPVGGG